MSSREPRPVEYLPAGAYPGASAQLLRAAQELLRECSAGEGEDEYRRQPEVARRRAVARSAARWCLDVLTENFLSLECLQRTNWQRRRPRLRLSATVGRAYFTLFVFPTRDGYVLGERLHFGELVPEAVVDFKCFPVNLMEPLRGQQIFQMRLEPDEADMLKREDAWVYIQHHHGFSEKTWEQLQRWEALSRQLLFLSWQAFVHRLTLVFDCELESELLAYGPHRLLDLRFRADHWPEVEDFDPDSTLKYTNSPQLDPKMRELLAQHRVHRSDFDAFVRSYLLPSVPKELHAATIAEYLGVREHHLVTPELAQDVVLRLDVEYQAKARRRRLQADPAEFQKVLDETGRSHYLWDSRMADSLNMNEDEFVVWVLRHFADQTEHLPLSGAALQRAVERHKELELLPVEVERLVARLVRECERGHRSGQPRTAVRRIQEMVKSAGFRSLEEAQAWAKKGKGRAALHKFLTAKARTAEREAGAAPAAVPAVKRSRARSTG